MFLDQIISDRLKSVQKYELEVPINKLKEEIISRNRPVHSLKCALQNAQPIGLVAEFKRASPSKGRLLENHTLEELIRVYDQAQVTALSVLTEPNYFYGCYQDLIKVRALTTKPILNKDFILTPWQLYKAKAIGADAVLIIGAALSKGKLKELLNLACSLDLEVVFEVHTLKELELALYFKKVIIGINNRDLHTFRTNLETTHKLIKSIPKDRVVLSESGVYSNKQVKNLINAHVQGILVGEYLVKSKDVKKSIGLLIGDANDSY